MKRFSSKQSVSVLIVCSMMASSCGQIISSASYQSRSDITQIIGQDDRVPEMDEMIVGSLYKNGEHMCTAFALGPQEIGTAGHCIADDIESLTWRTKEGEFKVLAVSKTFKDADYAILKIDGKNSSWFNVGKYDPKAQLKIVSAVMGDTLLSNVASGGSLSNGFILHSLDTIGGSSGSPILQNGRVVAVHLGSLKKSNVGVLLNEVEKIDLGQCNKEKLTIIEFVAVVGACLTAAKYTMDSIHEWFGPSAKKTLVDRIIAANTVSYVAAPAGEEYTVFMRDSTSKVVVDLDAKTVRTEGPVTQKGCYEAIDKAVEKSGRWLSEGELKELRGQCPVNRSESLEILNRILPWQLIMEAKSGGYVREEVAEMSLRINDDVADYHGSDPVAIEIKNRIMALNLSSEDRKMILALTFHFSQVISSIPEYQLTSDLFATIFSKGIQANKPLDQITNEIVNANNFKRSFIAGNWADISRRANGYCVSKGYTGGYIDGNWQNDSLGVVCTNGLLLQGSYGDATDGVTWADAYRRANATCNAHGYPDGYPDGNYGGGKWNFVCNGAVAYLFPSAGEVSVNNIPDSTNFRTAHLGAYSYCNSKGFKTGILNGNYASSQQIGVMCFAGDSSRFIADFSL